jgi:hypothetical protein
VFVLPARTATNASSAIARDVKVKRVIAGLLVDFVFAKDIARAVPLRLYLNDLRFFLIRSGLVKVGHI